MGMREMFQPRNGVSDIARRIDYFLSSHTAHCYFLPDCLFTVVVPRGGFLLRLPNFLLLPTPGAEKLEGPACRAGGGRARRSDEIRVPAHRADEGSGVDALR